MRSGGERLRMNSMILVPRFWGKGVPVIVRGFSNTFMAETEEATGSHFGWIEGCIGELRDDFGWMIGIS